MSSIKFLFASDPRSHTRRHELMIKRKGEMDELTYYFQPLRLHQRTRNLNMSIHVEVWIVFIAAYAAGLEEVGAGLLDEY